MNNGLGRRLAGLKTSAKPPLLVVVNNTVTWPSQLSSARTSVGGGTSPMHWTLALSGTPISCGGVVSCTLMTWKAVLIFLHLSIAVHVLVMKSGQLVLGPLKVLVNCTGTCPSQLSMAMTAAGGSTSLRHCTFRLGGTPIRTGLVWSNTVMVWTQKFELQSLVAT